MTTTCRVLFVTALAIASGRATSQCSNYSNTPPGSYVIADNSDGVRVVGLPFAFPFNGTLYTQMTVGANGWIKLGAVPFPRSGDDLESEATLLNTAMTSTNFHPRICVCWDDLHWSTFYGGTPAFPGVYYAADPLQVTVCWLGAGKTYTVPPFGFPAMAFANCECVLTSSGDIYLKYDTTCTLNLAPSATPIVGISKSDGTVAPGTHTFDWTNANPGPLSIADATGYQMFTNNTGAAPWDFLGGFVLHFAPTGTSTYSVTRTTLATCPPPTPLALATDSTPVGTGCPGQTTGGSIYELFTDSIGSRPVDLAGTSMTFVRSGSGYALVPGPGLDLVYTTSGIIETAAADDRLIAYPLTMGSFSFGGHNWSSIVLSTNGYLGTTGTTQRLIGSATYFHTEQPRIAAYWSDLVPNTTTAPIYIENTSTMFRATWHNVPHYNDGGARTFQVQLDQGTGHITLSYGALTASIYSDRPLVGICGGAPATDLGDDNLVTAGVANAIGTRLITPASPMSHTTSPWCQLGGPFTLTSTVRHENLGVGLWLIGTTNPTLSLDAIFGPGSAPGCSLYSDGTIDSDLFSLFPAGSGSFSKVIQVPFVPALAGLSIFTQAGALTTLNPAGVISSNGCTQTVGI